MNWRVITDNDWTTIGICATALIGIGFCVWALVVLTRGN